MDDLEYVPIFVNHHIANDECEPKIKQSYGKLLVKLNNIKPTDSLYRKYISGDYDLTLKQCQDPSLIQIVEDFIHNDDGNVYNIHIDYVPKILTDYITWDIECQCGDWGSCKIELNIELYLKDNIMRLLDNMNNINKKISMLQNVIKHAKVKCDYDKQHNQFI